MATGFRTRNATGGVQIDETYKNLALRSKGNLVPGTSWNGGLWRIGSITVTGNSPVLAWRSSSPAAMVSATKAGTSITYTFLIASTSGSIDWWLFDEPSYVGVPTNPGIRIKNPSTGVVTYDSRMKYMRVVGVISGDYGSNVPPASGSYSGSPALVTGNVAYRYVSNIVSQAGSPPFPWTDFVFYPFASLSGSTFSWSTRNSDPITHDPSETFVNPSQQDAYNYLVIDVANF